MTPFKKARWACLNFHSSKLPSYCYYCQIDTPKANLQAWQSNKIMRGLRGKERRRGGERENEGHTMTCSMALWRHALFASIYQLKSYEPSLFILATKKQLICWALKNPCCGNKGVLRGQRWRGRGMICLVSLCFSAKNINLEECCLRSLVIVDSMFEATVLWCVTNRDAQTHGLMCMDSICSNTHELLPA